MELKYEILETFRDNFSSAITKQHLRYGVVKRINYEFNSDPMSTFALPIFIKPGRTHFIIRTPEDQHIKSRMKKGHRVKMMSYHTKDDVPFKFYYNRHIIPMREEKVPGCKLHSLTRLCRQYFCL